MALAEQNKENRKTDSGVTDDNDRRVESAALAAGGVLMDTGQAERLVQQAKVRCSQAVMECIDEWASHRREENHRFRAIHTRCLNVASRVRNGGLSPDQCLEDLKRLVQEVLDTLGQPEEEAGVPDLSLWTPASWRERLSLVPSNTPATATLELPAGYWNSTPGDPRPIRRKKLLKRMERAVRAIIPGAARQLSTGQRTFSLPDFILFHLVIPFGRLLLEEWQVFLRNRSISRQKFRENTLAIFSELVILMEHGGTEPLTAAMSEKLDAYIRTYSQSDLDRSDTAGDEQRRRCTDRIAFLTASTTRALSYAGTSLLPYDHFSTTALDEQWAKLEKQYEESRRAWAEHIRGSQEDLRHDLILTLAEIEAVMLCRESILTFNARMEENYARPLKEVVAMISSASGELEKDRGVSAADLREQLLAHNRTLVRNLRNEKIPGVLDAMDAAQLPKVAENFLSRVEHVVRGLPEECRVFQKNSYDSLIPDSTFIDIPLRTLISTEALPPLAKEHALYLQTLQEAIETLRRDVSELDRAITFHLESALELLATGETEGSGHDAAAGGLTRTTHLAEKVIDSEESVARETAIAFSEMTARFIRRVHSFTDNEQVIALRAKIVQSRVKDEVVGYKKTVLGTSRKALTVALRFLENYTAWLRVRITRFRRAAGLSGPSKEEEEDLSLWLNTARVRIAALPFPYRRLFRIEPLHDKSFFAGRHEDLEAVEEDFLSWRTTRVGAVALVGEKGSGKTTILQCAMKEAYRPLPVHRIDLAGRSLHSEDELLRIMVKTLGAPGGETFDEIEKRLAGLPEPIVIIIEDIQNLFLRKVGGFCALERLLLLISTTSHSVYWVVTCTRYTWRYFEKVLAIPRFFRREIHLEGIPHEDIENIIMGRHRISGYNLTFRPTPQIEQSKKYGQLETEEERQAYVMDDCFDRINEVASGNITLAILCWLTACMEVKDDTVIVSFTPPDANTLNHFPATDLFTLAAVLQHETLSAAEHAEIFHQDLQQSLLLLRRLVAKGLLIENSQLFQINSLLYRSAVRTLTSKNILH